MADSNVPSTSGFSIRNFYRKNTQINVDQSLIEYLENPGSELETDISDSETEINNPDMDSNSEHEHNDFSSSTPVPNVRYVLPPNNNNNRVINARSRTRNARGTRGRGRGRGRGRVVNIEKNEENIWNDILLGWIHAEADDQIPAIPEFSAHSGINNAAITQESTPFDIFSLFFDDEIFNLIKVETNRYARERIDKEINKSGNLEPKRLLSRWKGVTKKDIKIFLAICLHMSLVRKPELQLYWSTKSIYATKFCKLLGMSRDRFIAILSMLHLNNNLNYKPRGHPNYDPLFKVRPIHDKLLDMFRQIYTLQENLTLDEGMCPFRGRLHFRVYIKGKPHKYGIKLYMVCEAASGYCGNFEVYTGVTPHGEDPEVYNTVNELVTRILSPYNNEWYTVYMDRYFSSPTVFDNLWRNNIKAVGTVQYSRVEMPKGAFELPIDKGEAVFQRRDHLLAVKWHDTRDVYILSTVHKAEMIRSMSVHNTVEKIKPAAIVSYNKNKCGVDRSDQLLSYNAFRRKSIKWWKKLFFHFLDLAVANSQILFNKSHPNNKLTLLSFYEKLCYGLIESTGQNLDLAPPPPNPPNKSHDIRLIPGQNHFLRLIPPTASKGAKAHRRCKVCYEKKKRAETKYICQKCETPLCVTPCFELYHTKKNYWE